MSQELEGKIITFEHESGRMEEAKVVGIDPEVGITVIGLDGGQELICLNKKEWRNGRITYEDRYAHRLRQIQEGIISWKDGTASAGTMGSCAFS